MIVGVEGSSNNSLSAVEEGFLQDMSAHHQQALAMAQLVDRPGVDPRVLTLARQIRVEQANEVGTMTGWLQMADRPIGNPTPMSWMTRYGSEGHGHGGGGGAPMPGMATEDELAALGSMPPEQAGTRFLQLMQRHHYGGIAMAEDPAQVPEGSPAARPIDGQHSEQGDGADGRHADGARRDLLARAHRNALTGSVGASSQRPHHASSRSACCTIQGVHRDPRGHPRR